MKFFKCLVALPTIFLLMGCSMLEKHEYGTRFQMRDYNRERLSNGLEIIWINEESLPRISFQLLVKAGAIYESSDESGLHALTSSMLGESTQKYTSQELVSHLEFLGIDFGSSGGSDFSTLNMSGLSKYSNEMLEFFFHILTESKFDSDDFQRRKVNTMAGLKRIQDNPSSVADVAFNRELFQGHSYGRLISGHPDTLNKFSYEDCIRIHKIFFRPQRSLLVVGGNFDKKFQDRLKAVFSKWERWEEIDLPVSDVKPVNPFAIALTKASLEQTQIRFGHHLVSRNHPDFVKIRTANMILGGAFASRLNQRIRDDLGLTYSVSSGVDANLLGGDLTISTFTRHDRVLEMVTEVRKVYEKFAESGVTEEELAGAKSVMIGQFPTALETTDRLGYNLMALWAYGISDEYLKKFQETVVELKRDEINKIIKQHFRPSDISVLLYTDTSKAEAQIKGLGIKKITDFKL